MKASVPAFATKEWLERNVLAGNGEVRECQRRTKAWRLAKARETTGGTVRKVFRAESGLHAVVVSGCVQTKYEAPAYARDYAFGLDVLGDGVVRGSVSVALFTCDAATGVWHALVLFRKEGAK